MFTSGTAPPPAVSASWPPLTEPFEAAVVAVAQRAVLAMPKRTSLSVMLPPTGRRLRDVDAGGAQHLRAVLLGGQRDRDADANIANIAAKSAQRLPARAHHPPEHEHLRRRDQEDREQLEEVRERRRVLERDRRVRVVEAAAVGAELLDRDLRRDRAARDRLLSRPASVVRGRVTRRTSATTPCETRIDGDDQRQRQQDVESER